MIKPPFFALAFLWLALLSHLSAANAVNPMIHQKGTTLVDAHGKPVQLRGVNLGGWLEWEGWLFGKGILTSETMITSRLDLLVGTTETQHFREEIYDHFITQADIQRLSFLGFNSVRVPINSRLLSHGEASQVYHEEGWQRIDQLLQWCEQSHVYVILDLHDVPGGQAHMPTADPGKTLVWDSPPEQQETVDMWHELATRYKDRTIIAGYDLINEPVPPQGADLAQLDRKIIAAIRSVDPNHLVIVEGGKLAQDFTMFSEPPDANMAYSFHMYTWFGDGRQKTLETYLKLSHDQQVPLWCGEFGENKYEMIHSTVALYESHPEIAGWAFWTWKKAPSHYPGLVTVDVPSDWEKTIAWISNPWLSPKPTPDQALRGMAEFINGLELSKTHFDSEMKEALLGP